MRSLLTAIAATMLVIANIVAVKIVSITIPIVGNVSASAGVFPIAVTFFCTDVISERYGKKASQRSVYVIVTTLALAWGMLWLAVQMPHGGGVSQEAFSVVLLSSTPLVVASVTTAVLSQTLDVSLFHRLLTLTDGKHRWVRNIGSTSVSQFVDVSVFTVLAFVIFPTMLGGSVLSWSTVISIIFVEYVIRLALALLDTPAFYAVTGGDSHDNST